MSYPSFADVSRSFSSGWLWLVTLFRTALGVASGVIFQPHP